MSIDTPDTQVDEDLVEPFAKTASKQNGPLTRSTTAVLQVNVGLLCNQTCRHCHLEAGPNRTECMDLETAMDVVDYAGRAGFETVDVTGGAPEMNPNIEFLLKELATVAQKVMLRSNLTAIGEEKQQKLIEVLVANKICVVASFPSLSAAQADGQRGKGVFDRSIKTLKMLNEKGYGREGSGLELDLVSNPAGAFLPPDQVSAEKRFRGQLARKYEIEFNNLYTFANVPLGRFKKWLESSGNYQAYLKKLSQGFNPCAMDGVMCRGQVSVNWEGYVYDCDFNIAAGLPLCGKRIHVRELEGPPSEGAPIMVGDHCYTCTAGAGFT